MAKKSGKKEKPEDFASAALETMRKGFLIGLGATVKTADMLKESLDHLVTQGELSQKDAKHFAKDIAANVKAEKDHLEAQVKKMVDAQLKQIIQAYGLATKEDLATLKRELKAGETSTAKASTPKATAKKSTAKKATPAKKPAPKKPAAAVAKKASPKPAAKKAVVKTASPKAAPRKKA